MYSITSLKELTDLSMSLMTTMTLQKVIDVLGLIEAGIMVSENTDSNEQQAVTTIQGFMRMFAFLEEALKEKKRS
jgi:hypothetical protein